MKRLIKLLMTVVMITMVFITISNVVLAAPENPSKYTGDSSYSVDTVETLGNQIIQIISTIGSIASVIVLIILGIKYMMGSAEEKAEYKKTLMPYVIGAALVFAASAIAGIIYGFTGTLGGQ